jgi:hypothetical protein
LFDQWRESKRNAGFPLYPLFIRAVATGGQNRWVAAMPFQTLQAVLNEPDQPELT